MRNTVIVISIALCAIIVLLSDARMTLAQGEGFITSLSGDQEGQQDSLPSESERQGNQVLHVVAPKENLHLLAAYYYGNPRQWKRIYHENRNVIRNPRILTVGQTLQITVDENWKPEFSYQEWFRLATRNGEWAPGRWKRSSRTPSRQQSTGTQEIATTPAVPQDTPDVEPEKTSETSGEKTSTVEEGSQPEEESSGGEQTPAF